MVLLLVSAGIQAEDELDFEDSVFDDISFDDVEFEADPESGGNWFQDNFSLKLSHDINSSKNPDWTLTGNKSTVVLASSYVISPALYTEFEGQLALYL